MKVRKVLVVAGCLLFVAASVMPALAGNGKGKGKGGAGKGSVTATKSQDRLRDGSCLASGTSTAARKGAGGGTQARDGSCGVSQ